MTVPCRAGRIRVPGRHPINRWPAARSTQASTACAPRAGAPPLGSIDLSVLGSSLLPWAAGSRRNKAATPAQTLGSSRYPLFQEPKSGGPQVPAPPNMGVLGSGDKTGLLRKVSDPPSISWVGSCQVGGPPTPLGDHPHSPPKLGAHPLVHPLTQPNTETQIQSSWAAPHAC
jgi:hypothetical protein